MHAKVPDRIGRIGILVFKVKKCGINQKSDLVTDLVFSLIAVF